MSDEQPPPIPPLRLKPRLRPADAPTPAGVPPAPELPAFEARPPVSPEEPAPAAQVPAATPAVPKIRFKPRLQTTDTPSDAAAAAAPSAAPSPTPESIGSVAPPPGMANPVVAAPGPLTSVQPPAPVESPPLFKPAETPPANAPAAVAPAVPAVPAEGVKFKLKPKLPAGVVVPPAEAPPPPPVSSVPVPSPQPAAAPPGSVPPIIPAAPPAPAKAPPPFPVVATPGVKKAPPPPFAPTKPTLADRPIPSARPKPVAQEGGRGTNSALLKLLVVVVLLAGGYFGWQYLGSGSSAPAPAPTPAAKAPTPPPKAETPITPSDTLNQLAHAPKKAINKAQEVINAREASGQTRIDATTIGEDLPDPAGSQPAAKAPQPSEPKASPSTVAPIAPGVAATAAQVEAVPEASVAFRTFIANARVSGVFEGPPTRAMVNGVLIRPGEILNASLGITFKGVDPDRRHLLFVDRTGAIVTRRY